MNCSVQHIKYLHLMFCPCDNEDRQPGVIQGTCQFQITHGVQIFKIKQRNEYIKTVMKIS